MSVSAMGWLQASLGLDITGEWNRLVHLTVGGIAYSCQRKTFRELRSDALLCKMVLEDAFPRAEDGSFVIDRDGQTFRHVLNFLRTGKLLLADGFDEWDLLLDDALVYGIKKLEEAITNHPSFQRRQFRRALPASTYLRFDDVGDANGRVHLVPPLPMFCVHSETGRLTFHAREVTSVDEAASILISTYEMSVEHWEVKDSVVTIIFSLRP